MLQIWILWSLLVGSIKCDSETIRLPRHNIPILYDLVLQPYLYETDSIVSGNVTIHLEHIKSEKEDLNSKIFLHAKEIAIFTNQIEIVENGAKLSMQGTTFEHDEERQIFVIHLSRPLQAPKSNISVYIPFESYLHEDLAGFYKSSYLDPERQSRVPYAVTQFWWGDARRAFPCMDEPDLKAIFKLQLVRPKEMTAIANMPLVKTTSIDDHFDLDEFEPSLKMSTYLLAFFVSDFEFIPADYQFRIWHTPGKAAQAALAADAGPKILRYYETFFNVTYPLKKTDMVALNDLFYGAMENWGMITYKETGLLYEPGTSSLTDWDRVIKLVAHELAHMWFGNLVTMKWWTDLWLNEGFATYVQNIGKDHYDPNLESKDRSIIFDLQDIMETDGLDSTKAISIEINDPKTDMTFTQLSYSKGACLIRMLENVITTITFRKGINRYIQRHAYANADRYDLWSALDEVAKEDGTLGDHLSVKDIMESWAAQPGYPVIQIENAGTNLRRLRQTRFRFDQSKNESSFPERYFIPITLTYAGESFNHTAVSKWFQPHEGSTSLLVDPKKVYLLNVQQTGYYRVNYDEDHWKRITALLSLSHQDIHRINRAQLIDDSFNLARAGLLRYDIPLNISKYIKIEDDYIPLAAARRAFEYLELMLRKQPDNYKTLKQYLLKLVEPMFSGINFSVESRSNHFMNTMKDVMVASWACKLESQHCLNQAKEIFQRWKMTKNPDMHNPINPDYKPLVYDTISRLGDEENRVFLWQRFKNALVAGERSTILKALGLSPNPTDLEELLGMAIDPSSEIMKQDAPDIFESIGSTLHGRKLQVKWLIQNSQRFQSYFEALTPEFAGQIAVAFLWDAASHDDLALVHDISQSFNDSDILSGQQVLLAMDRALANQHWVETSQKEVLQWLQLQPSSACCLTLNLLFFSLIPFLVQSL